MSVRRLDPRDFVRQPWKNGGGFTTELASHPPLWRVSIADVEQSGPFSDFSGYERTIMLLEGDGMELSFDTRPPVRIEKAFEPFSFDGAWKTDCRLLGGPVRDFNLMVQSGHAAGGLRVATAPCAASTGDWTLIYVLEGQVEIGPQGVGKGELLWLEAAPPSISLGGPGRVALITIRAASLPIGDR